jgi:3-oxoacyl-[acyl-carrier protein] reductase
MNQETRMRFAGKTAIVVGAAGSIGGAIAQGFAREGANVAMVDRNPANDIGKPGQSIAFQIDITEREAVLDMVRVTVERFGRIDILVNAAGITSFGSAAALPEAEWDRVLAINLKGVFLCCQAVIPVMRQLRAGRIINIGSIPGKNGGNARPWLDAAEQNRSANVAYGVSKAGVHAMTL